MQVCRRIPIPTIAMLIGACLFGWQAEAQDLYRVRGTLTEAELPNLVVESHDNERVATMLNDETGIYVVTPGAREDVQQGQFVGITTIGMSGDRLVALEVHIFAEELRGLGEGHYPWDLGSEPTMMTNAAIVEIESVDNGPVLTVTYSEGEESGNATKGQQQIMIPEDVPVVHFANADRAMLTAGRDVFLLMQNDDAGTPVLLGIVVGDGIAPPM